MQGASAGTAAQLGAAAGQASSYNKIGGALGDYFKDQSYSSQPYNADTGRGTLAAKTDDQWANNWDY